MRWNTFYAFSIIVVFGVAYYQKCCARLVADIGAVALVVCLHSLQVSASTNQTQTPRADPRNAYL